jgi:Kef-type K+ transport system membrane component KefB
MNGEAVLQVLLVMDVVGMYALAVFYLTRRRMSWRQYLGWGLVAIIFPLLGPFLVIASHPGERRKKHATQRVSESFF